MEKLNGTLQQQLSNGEWADCEDRTDEFLDMVSACYGDFSRDQIITALGLGRKLKNGSEWYSKCRIKPEEKPEYSPALTLCSCGHEVGVNQVMNTSTGTSCPDCYDDMDL